MSRSAAPALKIRDIPMFPLRDVDWDDFTYLDRVKACGPLVRDDFFCVHTFSHADMQRLLDDRITRQLETEMLDLAGIGPGPMRDFFSNVMLFSNGETHRNRRTPLARSFAFPLVRAMRPEIRATVEDLIRPHVDAGETEFVDDIAGPLPARVVARILGLSADDVPYFTKLVYSSIRVLSRRSAEVYAEAEADLAVLNDWVADLLAARKSGGYDDFLTDYLGRVEGSPLSEEEIRIQITGLILAGSDTTRSALAMTLTRLLQHPGQWAALVADPDGVKEAAVLEGLRFDPVVGALARVAVAPFDLHGVRIPEGGVLSMSLLGAMRDPDVYAEPVRFDISRSDHPAYHPAFGGGAHRCLGEALARVELEEALAVLARSAPRTDLIAPAALRGLSGVRGIGGMRVRLRA
jgi:cytochrome P450